MGRSAREPGRAEQPQRDHRRRLDLTGAVVTVDALHTQRATAEHLVEVTGADYIMTIKANQPRLLGAASDALAGPKTEFAEYSRRRCRASPDRPRRDPPRRCRREGPRAHRGACRARRRARAPADVLTAHGVATTGQGAPEAVRELIGTLLRQRADATVLLGAVLHRFRMVPSTHAGPQPVDPLRVATCSDAQLTEWCARHDALGRLTDQAEEATSA